jgi:hypothetical protein
MLVVGRGRDGEGRDVRRGRLRFGGRWLGSGGALSVGVGVGMGDGHGALGTVGVELTWEGVREGISRMRRGRERMLGKRKAVQVRACWSRRWDWDGCWPRESGKKLCGHGFVSGQLTCVRVTLDICCLSDAPERSIWYGEYVALQRSAETTSSSAPEGLAGLPERIPRLLTYLSPKTPPYLIKSLLT